MSSSGISTKNAPSPWVVLPHYAMGSFFFIVATFLLFFAAPDLSFAFIGPKILSVTHLFILGWVSMIIFGALYQLIPVVMEVKLFSEKLALTSFASLILGTVLLASSFWFSYIGHSPLKDVGGTLVIFAIVLFVINVLKTAKNSAVKTVENSFIKTSVYWLLLTVLFGMFILFNVAFNWVSKSNVELLKIHVLMGLIGWFMMLIIGVASTLMPMFFIAHQLNKNDLKWSYRLINIGLIFSVFSLYFFPNTIVLLGFMGLIFAGMILFFKYNYTAYKKRLRKKLDMGMRLSVLAFILFISSLVFGILSIISADLWPIFSSKIYVSFGISLVLGYFSTLILGQMYKTLPFIVWLQKYQDKVGKFKIPLPNELYSEKIASAHYYSNIAAFVFIIVGVLFSLPVVIQTAAVLYIITSILFAYNTFKIILHTEKTEALKSSINTK